MKRVIKTALTAAALTAAVMGAAATPASAQLSIGKNTQYPATGGTWEYGFWDVHVRSYYNVGGCHGSTVIRKLYGAETHRSRSIDTPGGQTSIAEIYTLNGAGVEAEYYYRNC